MKKTGRILTIVIGIIFLISGCYRIYRAFTNDADKPAKVEASEMISDVVSDKDGVDFCVTNVENVKSVGSGYSELTTDNNFVVVTIKIVNNSNEPYNVNVGRFLLLCNGAEYEYDSESILSVENVMWMDEINPGITKEYKIVYETPSSTDTDEYKLKIQPVNLSDRDSVYITLK